MAVISARWPEVAGEIDAAATTDDLDWISNGKEKTLIVSGIQLTSAYDRRSEAEVQATLIPPESSVATVYGMALGDLPRALLSRPQLASLRVVLMNPELAAVCCRAVDSTDWLADARVSLHLAWKEHGIATPFAAAPSTLRLAAARSAPVRDQVVLALARPFQDHHFRNMDPILDARLQENLPFVEQDGDVVSLFGSAPGQTAAVVSAGPTAYGQFDLLRTKCGEWLIVAVSTALKPLMAADILPDVVVVIDPKEEMVEHFRGVDADPLRNVPLVYLPTVHADIIRMWPGRRLATYIHRPRFERLAEKMPRGRLFCDGSVTHAAVDLVVQMGVNEVILVGADFSFPENKRHVAGAVDDGTIDQGEGAAHPFVVNGLGGQNPSRTDMVGFLRGLETYIARQPAVTFRNTGRAGAVIAGAEWLDG